MVEVCALASGSNGNSYYIGNGREAILIDAGINCKQLLLRLESKNLDPFKIKAVFVTHEHIDHVAGVRVFCNKFKIPAFFTNGTFQNLSEKSRPTLYRFFQIGKSIPFEGFTIYPFQKNHDAAEPCSFTIDHEGVIVGVLTDVGIACDVVISQIQRCNILFLETNYDEDMLWKGMYPWPLKKRIASENGHLSNKQAFDLIALHASTSLKTIFLSHLSGENNSPEIVSISFDDLKLKHQIVVTSRHQATEVFQF